MIAGPVPPCFGGIEQDSDFGFAQKVFAPLMGVRGGYRGTFYISPIGQCFRPHWNPADFLSDKITLFTKCGFVKSRRRGITAP